ncbi:MAG: hypothetical protein AABO41_15050 [Acidobacteriota bacterium]
MAEVAPPNNAPALEAAIEFALQRIDAGCYKNEETRRRIVEMFSVTALVANTGAAVAAVSRQSRVM